MTMRVSRAMLRFLFPVLLLFQQQLFPFLILWWYNDNDVATAATITTNRSRYLINTPIQLSWNYTSSYNGVATNLDSVVIVFNDTIPTVLNLVDVVQMYVHVSTLRQDRRNATLRNVGTVTFDANDPEEGLWQIWPLQIGHYKAYLFDPNNSNFPIYAASDTFTIYPPLLSTNKRSYYFNESIVLSWEYTSSYTGTGSVNQDYIGIYDSTIDDVDFLNPILFVWVSSLVNGVANTTIRNIGTVTFDSNPPDEYNLQSWPLQVGSYKAILTNYRVGDVPTRYTESDTFVIVPATLSPTNAPTKAPSTTIPSVAPNKQKKQLFCNVFLLRYIFCSDPCGFIGRLLKLCKITEE